MRKDRTFLRFATYAMGTRFEFVLAGDDEVRLRAAGEEAITDVEELHSRLNAFSSASMVSYINRCAALGPIGIDRQLFDLLQAAQEVYEQSGGCFDITIGQAMRQWGFRGGTAELEPLQPAPPAVSSRMMELDAAACTVRMTQPGMEIDLGGIAKGFALDCAAETVRQAGVECALLHGGTSTTVTIGAPDITGNGWRVRIHDEHEPLEVVLRDEALSVSSPRGRMYKRGEELMGHVIDPRTGNPSRAAETAAVVTQSAMVADAWSTAILVAGARPIDTPVAIRSAIRRGGAWDICETVTTFKSVPSKERVI